MPKFTGKSINMSIQEAFEDAVRHARMSKLEEVHEPISSVEITRIYADRTGTGAFNNVFVEVEAR